MHSTIKVFNKNAMPEKNTISEYDLTRIDVNQKAHSILAEESLPMQQILFDKHMYQGTHSYLSCCSIGLCAVWADREDVKASCRPGGGKKCEGEVIMLGA